MQVEVFHRTDRDVGGIGGEVQEVPGMMRCLVLCLLEVLEVPDVMHCVVLCLLKVLEVLEMRREGEKPRHSDSRQDGGMVGRSWIAGRSLRSSRR